MAKTYFDYPLDGAIDSQGHILNLYSIRAVENALSCWISSFKGEDIRAPHNGGFIVALLEKNVDEETASDIAAKLKTELEFTFSPSITIGSITVFADMQNDLYNISIKGYIAELKQFIDYYDQFGRLT